MSGDDIEELLNKQIEMNQFVHSIKVKHLKAYALSFNESRVA